MRFRPTVLGWSLAAIAVLAGLLACALPDGMAYGIVTVLVLLLFMGDSAVAHARLRGASGGWRTIPTAHATRAVRLRAWLRIPAGGGVHLGGPASAGKLPQWRIPARAAWSLAMRERGMALIPSCQLRVRGPCGLGSIRTTIGDAVPVLVLPAPAQAKRRTRVLLARLGGEYAHRDGLGIDEPHRLREREARDPLSRVAWRASARRGSLLIMQRAGGGSSSVAVVLDLALPTPTRPERLEYLIISAQAILASLFATGAQVRLHTTAHPQGISGGLAELSETLALARVTPGSLDAALHATTRMPRVILAFKETALADPGHAVLIRDDALNDFIRFPVNVHHALARRR